MPEAPGGSWHRNGIFGGALRCCSHSSGDGRSSNSWTTSLKTTWSGTHTWTRTVRTCMSMAAARTSDVLRSIWVQVRRKVRITQRAGVVNAIAHLPLGAAALWQRWLAAARMVGVHELAGAAAQQPKPLHRGGAACRRADAGVHWTAIESGAKEVRYHLGRQEVG